MGLVLLLTSCGVQQPNYAKEAESKLVGLSELELHLCAGFPSKTETVDGVTLETDETTTAPPNMSLTLPTLGPLGGGGLGVGGSQDSYCRATFALVRQRVTNVYYSGNTATSFGYTPLGRCGWSGAARSCRIVCRTARRAIAGSRA